MHTSTYNSLKWLCMLVYNRIQSNAKFYTHTEPMHDIFRFSFILLFLIFDFSSVHSTRHRLLTYIHMHRFTVYVEYALSSSLLLYTILFGSFHFIPFLLFSSSSSSSAELVDAHSTRQNIHSRFVLFLHMHISLTRDVEYTSISFVLIVFYLLLFSCLIYVEQVISVPKYILRRRFWCLFVCFFFCYGRTSRFFL